MDYIRTKVSGKKLRYTENGFNLDLSYITPRIIAMSLPGEGVHRLYRNSISSVSKFLNSAHKSSYKILNLSGIKYDYSKFNENVEDFKWTDHYPPEIDVLFKACQSIHNWLSQSSNNVVVVNCKAGKGRTGTLICCYLIFSRRFSDWKQATSYYRSKRFSRGGGVTQPSQLRYIQYFTGVLRGEIRYPLVFGIDRIHLRTVPHITGDSCRIIAKIYLAGKKIFSNKLKDKDRQISLNDNWEDLTIHELVQFSQEFLICGDVTLSLSHWGLVSTKLICRTSFNTAFVAEDSVLFEKPELDPDNFKNSKEVSDKFYIHLLLTKPCPCTEKMSFEERCEKCREILLTKEKQNWDEISEILKICPENSTFLLFGELEDDVNEVLARSIDDSGYSSDLSN